LIILAGLFYLLEAIKWNKPGVKSLTPGL